MLAQMFRGRGDVRPRPESPHWLLELRGVGDVTPRDFVLEGLEKEYHTSVRIARDTAAILRAERRGSDDIQDDFGPGGFHLLQVSE